MSRRHYVNEAPVTALTGAVDSAATSIPVASLVGMPSVLPYTAEIDGGTASAEVVLVTAVIGSTATVSRAYNGTSGQTHNGGATFQHVAVAMDFDEANSHVNSTTGVHGVTGTIVGTTQAQTITNKSFQNNVHITGADTVPGVDIATVAGAGIALQARAGFTINASLTGAGALSLNSTLTVAGATALQALTATTVTTTGAVTTGALTAASASITGAATVGSTLNVLGATTLGALTANTLTLGTTPVTTYTACLSTARPAAPVLGALIYETDTRLSYRWDGTVWRALSQYAEVTRNSLTDPVGKFDEFTGLGSLVAVQLVDAPAGVYEIVAHSHLASNTDTAPSGGYMQVLCSSGGGTVTDVNLNARDDYINIRGVHTSRPYAHTGGDLVVTIKFQVLYGTSRCFAWGTYANVKRVI